MEIADVNVCWAHSYGKRRWYEGIVSIFADDGNMQRFNFDFPIEDMSERGVCRTLNSFKKIQVWANTEEGHSYILSKMGLPKAIEPTASPQPKE